MAIHEFDYKKEPTVSIVKQILTDAIKLKASDIHFNPITDGLVIKFRTDGDLIEYTKAPESVKKNILTRIKILAGMNITESTLPQNGSITFDYRDENYNMRASTLPILDGEKIVVHLSNYQNTVNSLDTLNISNDNLKKIKKLIKNKNGLILITGNESSGKTTTMYTLIKELDSEKNSIISIEDPVKMKIDGINQVQISKEKGLTTSKILRNILAQDPNIIVLSEMNDDETTRSILRATTTGRLVISTMYSKNAYDTLYKLTNMEVEKYLLKTSLAGIISQRLVKKLCPICKTTKEANDYEKNIFKTALNQDINEIPIAVGCPKCIDGYQGRIPITEVIEINDAIKAELSSNTNQELLRKIIYQNNKSILEDGLQKILNKETTIDEIIRITDISNDFGKYNKDIKNSILGETIPTINEEVEESENNIQLEEITTTSTPIENYITNIDEKQIETTKENTETIQEINVTKDNEIEVETPVENTEPEDIHDIEVTNIIENNEETISEQNITPEEEKESDEIAQKIKNDIEKMTKKKNNDIPTENNLSKNQGMLDNIERISNYDDFSYDESYINNF